MLDVSDCASTLTDLFSFTQTRFVGAYGKPQTIPGLPNKEFLALLGLDRDAPGQVERHTRKKGRNQFLLEPVSATVLWVD